MNLNVEKWKEFRIVDLFDISLASGDLKLDDCENGDIPLVSSGQINNGIVGYIDINKNGKSEIFNKNKITVDMFCNAFYQNKDFYAVSHGRVNILTPKFEMNDLTALFIVTIINNEKHKFSYGRALYSNVISEMLIKLPCLDDETLDCEFMQNYMKKLKFKAITTKNKKHYCDLNVDCWQEYNLKDLFDVVAGKYHYPNEYENGNTPYISASNMNNGVAQKINLKPEFKGNCIVTGKVGCTAFYQPDDFCATSDVNVLIPKNFSLTKEIGLFIVSVINKSENYKWGYGRQCRVGDVKKIIIKLPTKNEKPDWEYIKNYIQLLPYGDRI